MLVLALSRYFRVTRTTQNVTFELIRPTLLRRFGLARSLLLTFSATSFCNINSSQNEATVYQFPSSLTMAFTKARNARSMMVTSLARSSTNAGQTSPHHSGSSLVCSLPTMLHRYLPKNPCPKSPCVRWKESTSKFPPTHGSTTVSCVAAGSFSILSHLCKGTRLTSSFQQVTSLGGCSTLPTRYLLPTPTNSDSLAHPV